MSFNVTALGEWVQNNRRSFVGRVFENATSIRLLLDGRNAQVNNKPGKSVMVFANVDVNLTDSACGRSNGSTPMFDKEIITEGIMANESYCPKDLYKTYASWALRNGMNPEGEFDIAFLDFLVDEKLSALNKANEKLVWMGDKASANNNLNRVDGYVKLIRADVDHITLSSSSTDVITRLQEMYVQMPTEVVEADDFKIFIGTDEYKKYQIAVSNRNLFNPESENQLFGTDGMLVPTPGLSGTGIVVMGRLSDLVISTDLESDLDSVNVSYDNHIREYWLDIDYALGTQIGRGEYIGITAAGPAPAITTQPTSQTIEDGETVTVSVVATDAGTYQWQVDNGTGFENIAGANLASYTSGALDISDSGIKYRVIVSNANGSVTSNEATITVTA